MKYNLLVAASALVVGLSMSGAAFADPYHPQDPPKTTSTAAAVALTDQDGAVMFDFAKGTVDGNTINATSGTGLFNLQQNGGANSIVQDQNTLGAVLNCSCSTATDATAVSLAASSQSALVLGDVSIGAVSSHDFGNTSESSGGHVSFDERHGFSAGGGSSEKAAWDNTHTAVGSSNGMGDIGGTGLFNISQNTGNNSMLQSANTVAVIIGK